MRVQILILIEGERTKMTEATLHHVCEGAVVLYKRDGSNTECWYARFKNPRTGKWKKFSTKETDLEKAKLDGEARRKVTAMLYE